MKIDIENKILIPFMILIILSIFTMSAVSYYNSYKMLLNNEVEYSKNNLKEMVLLINTVNDEIKNESEAKKYIINLYKNAKKSNLIIYENNNILLDTNYVDNWTKDIITEKLENENKTVTKEKYIFVYEKYEKYNWVIGYSLNKDILFNEVVENEKNIILVAIVSLIFCMEAAILISYNISKPIKKLAEHCDKITDQDSFDEKIEIKSNDEIGSLSNAFNNMLFRIKNITEKMTEVTRFNEDILKSIPAGIITTNENGQLLSINEAAKKLLHENKERNVDVDILENIIKQINNTLDENKIINKVLNFKDMDGNNIYLDVTTSLLIGVEGLKDGAICNFNDISERKKFETNMDILDRLTTIGQFAAGIAHEIRNPLTGMKTSIQVLKNRLCKDENISNENLFIGVIHEIDRINKLITNLLNFAKPRVPYYEETDIIEILNRALDLVRKYAKENNININVKEICGNKKIYADKAQIEQIFLNIIKNSLNAIKNDGKIDISICENFGENGHFIEIEFQDNGCGIHPKDMDKIFNPFFTTSNQGTGLGLSVVYELVKSNQGTINVQSIVNEGTKVKIEFLAYRGV
ncbi:MAG: hypothetical protein K0Q97_1947 [Bacillota bacterium]|nr:hypothetical protein [Bacillota bacterium]